MQDIHGLIIYNRKICHEFFAGVECSTIQMRLIDFMYYNLSQKKSFRLKSFFEIDCSKICTVLDQAAVDQFHNRIGCSMNLLHIMRDDQKGTVGFQG